MKIYPHVYVTRYMGAKYKLLNFIAPNIENLLPEGGTLVDLMAGTHSIGYALQSRYRIVANDIQYYSKIFGKALIENRTVFSVADRFRKDFSAFDPYSQSRNWLISTYSDTYFSEYQCREISNIRDLIDKVDHELVKCIYLTYLANAMSTCQSSSGHFAQYFPKTHPRLASLRKMSIFEEFERKAISCTLELGQYENVITQMEAKTLINQDKENLCIEDGALVYFDPPYSTAQYSRYYHLLDTVFLNDQPDVQFKGLYRPNRFQSEFCSPKRVKEAFQEIVESVANRHWNLCISYTNEGLASIEFLVELCEQYFRKVRLEEMNYAHSMQGRGVLKSRQEILIIANH